MTGTDKLLLEGMEFFGHHGDSEAERERGATITVDVTLTLDTSAAGHSDDLANTVDYSHCYETIRGAVENQRFHLLEALAERIAGLLLENEKITNVHVRVAKKPPLPGTFRSFAVQITREKT